METSHDLLHVAVLEAEVMFTNKLLPASLLVTLLIPPIVWASGQEGIEDLCDRTALPTAVGRLVARTFPLWRVLRLSDLSTEHHMSWLKNVGSDKCPGIANGHFETTKALSYALSLVPQSPHAHGYRLVVASKKKDGNYILRVLEKFDDPVNPQVVYAVPPGKYYDFERVGSIQLFMDGFQVEQMEVGATLFYWKAGQYHKFTVSE